MSAAGILDVREQLPAPQGRRIVLFGTFGTSQEGFDAEWRLVGVNMVGGDLINRCELFDEEDLDAAISRFDELSR